MGTTWILWEQQWPVMSADNLPWLGQTRSRTEIRLSGVQSCWRRSYRRPEAPVHCGSLLRRNRPRSLRPPSFRGLPLNHKENPKTQFNKINGYRPVPISSLPSDHIDNLQQPVRGEPPKPAAKGGFSV